MVAILLKTCWVFWKTNCTDLKDCAVSANIFHRSAILHLKRPSTHAKNTHYKGQHVPVKDFSPISNVFFLRTGFLAENVVSLRGTPPSKSPASL
jgi:hypothetical protein